MTLDRVRDALARAGFDLTATLAQADYDARVPEAWRAQRVCAGCRGILVVGNAGHGLWPRFRAAPEARLRRDPLDRYTARVLAEASRLAGPGGGHALYRERREEHYLPLVRLAERAGLGRPGRLGLLLHPDYGPWIALRGVLYLPWPTSTRPAPPFDPCRGCPAPCAPACPGAAVGAAGIDGLACFRSKLLDRRCRAACDARAACVLGREHAFGAEQVAHHSRIRWRPAVLRPALRALAHRGPTERRGGGPV